MCEHKPSPYEGEAGRSWSPFLFIHSSFFAEERRNRKKRRRPELKGTHTSFFNYSMNSLRSNSISYLVAQPKVETRYNRKNLHAFQPFRAKCRHACRLEFLAVIFLTCYVRNCKKRSKLVSPK